MLINLVKVPKFKVGIGLNEEESRIVDYNIGNLFSIKNIIKYIGARVYITNDPQILEDSNLIILPGVDLKTAIDSIRNNNLDKFLVDMANKNKTMLGICLGCNFSQEPPLRVEFIQV